MSFGGTAAASVSVSSDSSLTAVVPAHAAGTVDVVVSGPGGSSPTTSADKYTYTSTPSITGIFPAAGPPAGGATITITGGGFTGATKVSFGTVAASGLAVVSDNQLTVTAPPGTGTAAIRVHRRRHERDRQRRQLHLRERPGRDHALTRHRTDRGEHHGDGPR